MDLLGLRAKAREGQGRKKLHDVAHGNLQRVREENRRDGAARLRAFAVGLAGSIPF